MTRRWWVVLAVTAVLLLAPAVPGLAARVPDSEATAADLAARAQASGGMAWSGFVRTTGALQVPESDSFAGLAALLGEDNDLRVWWASGQRWRIDRIRSTGETDLFRDGSTSIRWVFESETATVTPVSQIRLPDASDLLPPTLARQLLQGARPEELSRLPSVRIAGVDAAGLRLTPDEPAGTVDHVDLFVDPVSGLPLRVALFGRGDARAVVTSTVVDLTLGEPDPRTTLFSPAEGVDVDYEDSVDVAAAANAFAAYDLPATLGGLGVRNGVDPGAVGVYGRGPTTVIVLPLRGQVAGPLRQRLRDNGAQDTDVGTLQSVGPVTVLITPGGRGRNSFLLAGTATGETLQRAASELLAGLP